MKIVKNLMIIGMIILTIYAIGMRLNEMNVEYTEAEYTVCEGDTLWSIAEKYADNSTDIRQYIHKIKTVNNIDSTLSVGQTIIVFK